jgi:hypothetical protein
MDTIAGSHARMSLIDNPTGQHRRHSPFVKAQSPFLQDVP